MVQNGKVSRSRGWVRDQGYLKKDERWHLKCDPRMHFVGVAAGPIAQIDARRVSRQTVSRPYPCTVTFAMLSLRSVALSVRLRHVHVV
jgi:hypothetical protein